MVNGILRRGYKATLKAAKTFDGDTDVSEAIKLIRTRLKMLDSDELYVRKGHKKHRIPGEYKLIYRKQLENALALLVDAETVYLKQRANIREAKEEERKGLDLSTPEKAIEYIFAKEAS